PRHGLRSGHAGPEPPGADPALHDPGPHRGHHAHRHRVRRAQRAGRQRRGRGQQVPAGGSSRGRRGAEVLGGPPLRPHRLRPPPAACALGRLTVYCATVDTFLPPPGPRRDRILALIFMAVAALFRLPRLGVPWEEVFDEVYHARTALQYLQGENPVEWVHPPTAKLFIGIGVWLFGYVPWAWRLLPAVAGVTLAGVFFTFARRVAATERAAMLATVILLCDGVYLVQSRVAMTNIFAVLFQVTAAY